MSIRALFWSPYSKLPHLRFRRTPGASGDMEISDIADAMEVSVATLRRLARISDGEYRPHTARIGGKVRVIHAPSPKLKELQSHLLRTVIGRIPVSAAATCVRGKGIIWNAEQHVRRGYISLRDIRHCFHSVKLHQIVEGLELAGLSPDAARWTTSLCTTRGLLPLGPPTSPQLLNIALIALDREIGAFAEAFGATYTRYVDDMCFSADRSTSVLMRDVSRSVAAAGFDLNNLKSRNWGPGQGRTVTGIAVSTTISADPLYVREISRVIRTSTPSELALNHAKLQAQIGWIRRLDERAGQGLLRRFSRKAGI